MTTHHKRGCRASCPAPRHRLQRRPASAGYKRGSTRTTKASPRLRFQSLIECADRHRRLSYSACGIANLARGGGPEGVGEVPAHIQKERQAFRSALFHAFISLAVLLFLFHDDLALTLGFLLIGRRFQKQFRNFREHIASSFIHSPSLLYPNI